MSVLFSVFCRLGVVFAIIGFCWCIWQLARGMRSVQDDLEREKK